MLPIVAVGAVEPERIVLVRSRSTMRSSMVLVHCTEARLRPTNIAK